MEKIKVKTENYRGKKGKKKGKSEVKQKQNLLEGTDH